MAYQGIGTGTLPNDDTGDNLRDAGIKINDNFSELYSHFGDGTNLTAIVGTGIATENGIVGTGVTLIEFKGSAVGEVVVGSGIATITVSDFQESLYGDTDVNAHLNLSSAGTNEVLSYDGSDYTWVSNAGYTNSNVDTHLNQSNPTAGYVLSWNGTDYAWVEQSGGSDGVVVQEEGSDVGTATTINFVGTGVTATFDSGIATVSIIGIPTDTGDLTNNVGFATTGALVGLATTGALVGLATTGALVGFITSGDSGAGLTALTGAEQGTYGNGTNSAQITVDANGRITSISQVAISGGGGGGGISGINVYDNEDTSLGVTTNISFNNNLDVVSIGNTFTVSVTGVVTSLVGYATTGYVDNAVVGLATTGALVGLATTGALVGLATTGALVGLATTGALVGLATTGALVGFITSGDSGAGLTGLTGATEGTWGNANNVAEITVDANGRITGISNVAISGGGGGGGISGINVFNNETSLGVTTNINFGDNLNATAIGSTISVSVTGVVTSVVGLATTGALVGLATTGALVGLATTGDVFSGDYNDLTNKPTIPASQDLDNVLGVGNTSSTGMSVGLVTATAVTGFSYLQAPHGTTVEFAVTVASKTSAHRYPGGGSSSTNAYFINGVESPFLTLTPGRTYRFTNDNTGSHPLKFYLEADKTTEYTSGVSFQNSYTEITVSDETPTVLHYQCTAHGYMGNAVQTNSNKVNSPYVIVGVGFSTEGGTSSQFLKADGSVDSNTYLTSETSHSDVLVDGDFGSEGFMKRGASEGTYSIDSNTYLTTTGDGSSLTGIPTDGDFTSNGLMKRTGAGTYSIDSNTYLTTESDPIVAAINGIVKSDGSTISTATAGTDYLVPTGDGSGLTGIITSISAGTNITLTGGPTGIVTINSGTATTTGTFPATAGVAYTANTYTSSDFVTTEYTLFFQHSSGIQSQKVLVMDDETTAYSQEYAIMSSNSPLVSVGATIKSSNVELWFTPEPGVSGIITYKFTRETIS